MAKVKSTTKAEKETFGKRRCGKHSKAKTKQGKKYRGQG
jgi:hypothetical protein